MKLSIKIALWMKREVKRAGKKGIVLGLSGGIDSAVVACLARLAMGDNVLGLILPCESCPEDVELASKFAKKIGIKTKKISLDHIYKNFTGINPKASGLAKANLKPRLRMITLYYFANTMDYLVAGTGNKSELTIGYFTKYGDGGVDILPIGNLLKSEVRKLAVELGVPRRIIERPPSAGLWKGQTDEGEIGVSYETLDGIINAMKKKDTKSVDKSILVRVKKMIRGSEHKRTSVPIFRKY